MVHKSGQRRVGYSNEAPPPAATREIATRRMKQGPPEEETGWVAPKSHGSTAGENTVAPRCGWAGEDSSLCFFDDFVGTFLLPDNLSNTIIVVLYRRRSDYDGSLQAFEFACAASQLTVVGRTGKEVALLEDLISVAVSVGTKTVLFGGLGRSIYGSSKLAAPAHLVQNRIAGIV
jgi:hypothetical protein